MDRLTKKDFKFDMLNIINGRNKYCEIDDIMKALQSYEDTGLTPEEIADHEQIFKSYCSVCGGKSPEKVEQLQTENKELKELLVMAIADISAVNNCELCCFYDNDNNICTNLDSHCYKGNGFKWQHQDRLDKLLQEASE